MKTIISLTILLISTLSFAQIGSVASKSIAEAAAHTGQDSVKSTLAKCMDKNAACVGCQEKQCLNMEQTSSRDAGKRPDRVIASPKRARKSKGATGQKG